MRKRDVLLDFTSLLDVTLIIIFFFVLFSHFENVENKAEADAKVQELESAIADAQEREATAAELAEELEKELSIVRDTGKRQAENAEAMASYSKSENVKILLKMKDKKGVVKVCCKNRVVKELGLDGTLSTELCAAVENAGYKEKDTIYCDFVFDGSEPGTASAYRKVMKSFQEVKQKFQYLYYSETDLSMGEG